MQKRLGIDFYTKPSADVARELLGKRIIHNTPDGSALSGKIIETEAYTGPHDKASHAYGGKRTPRNRAVWTRGGHVYIYMVYGMYWQFNISTYIEGVPECVLLRGVLPENGDVAKANGPGKLCRYFKFDKSLYGVDLTQSDTVWIEDTGEMLDDKDIIATGRIGIDYAGKYWARRKLRFLAKDFENKLVKYRA
ncbi:MAG: DNA-3-methyladenine glycosylase [Candidatus Spechtbacterales bacterium]